VPSQPASGERWLRQRHWLALAAVLLAIAMLLPPVIGLARRQAYAEALQFVVFATVVPALLVTGAPWRLSRAGRAAGTGLADRVARSRSRHPALPRAGGYLLAYVAVIITWRLPVVVDAMARHPALLAAEVMTLVTVGCCFWIELVSAAAAAAATVTSAAGSRRRDTDVDDLGARLHHGLLAGQLVRRLPPCGRPGPQRSGRSADRDRHHVGRAGLLLPAGHLRLPDPVAAGQRRSG